MNVLENMGGRRFQCHLNAALAAFQISRENCGLLGQSQKPESNQEGKTQEKEEKKRELMALKRRHGSKLL